MSSVIYLGTLPRASQIVSSELKARGIPLLKAAPSDIKPLILTEAAANYGIYKHNLASYIRAAETGSSVLMNDPYKLFSSRSTPPFMANPRIVFTFNAPPSTEVRDTIKARFAATDILVKGKPALVATLSRKEVIDLIDSYNPVQTSPSSTTAINIVAFKQYVLLHRLFDTVCRTHQYAYNAVNIPEGRVEFDQSSIVKVDHMADEENENGRC